jgi:hypothetical protein
LLADLKMEGTFSSETSVDFNGLHAVTSEKIELFCRFVFGRYVDVMSVGAVLIGVICDFLQLLRNNVAVVP